MPLDGSRPPHQKQKSQGGQRPRHRLGFIQAPEVAPRKQAAIKRKVDIGSPFSRTDPIFPAFAELRQIALADLDQSSMV